MKRFGLLVTAGNTCRHVTAEKVIVKKQKNHSSITVNRVLCMPERIRGQVS